MPEEELLVEEEDPEREENPSNFIWIRIYYDSIISRFKRDAKATERSKFKLQSLSREDSLREP